MKMSVTILAVSILFATALSTASNAQSQQPAVKNIVLVHGAFADGTSWGKVIPILESRGFHVVAVQNPLTSLADDANATKRIIALQNGRVILVGHSWGGHLLLHLALSAPDRLLGALAVDHLAVFLLGHDARLPHQLGLILEDLVHDPTIDLELGRADPLVAKRLLYGGIGRSLLGIDKRSDGRRLSHRVHV